MIGKLEAGIKEPIRRASTGGELAFAPDGTLRINFGSSLQCSFREQRGKSGRPAPRSGAHKTRTERQPRPAASIAATSIFLIVIMASNARFASSPPAARAAVSMRGGDLPGNAPLVLAPSARAQLAAIFDDGIPVAVGLLLAVGGDLERKGFVVFEYRPPFRPRQGIPAGVRGARQSPCFRERSRSKSERQPQPVRAGNHEELPSICSVLSFQRDNFRMSFISDMSVPVETRTPATYQATAQGAFRQCELQPQMMIIGQQCRDRRLGVVVMKGESGLDFIVGVFPCDGPHQGTSPSALALRRTVSTALSGSPSEVNHTGFPETSSQLRMVLNTPQESPLSRSMATSN